LSSHQSIWNKLWREDGILMDLVNTGLKPEYECNVSLKTIRISQKVKEENCWCGCIHSNRYKVRGIRNAFRRQK
jgi:hypothetical protein